MLLFRLLLLRLLFLFYWQLLFIIVVVVGICIWVFDLLWMVRFVPGLHKVGVEIWIPVLERAGVLSKASVERSHHRLHHVKRHQACKGTDDVARSRNQVEPAAVKATFVHHAVHIQQRENEAESASREPDQHRGHQRGPHQQVVNHHSLEPSVHDVLGGPQAGQGKVLAVNRHLAERAHVHVHKEPVHHHQEAREGSQHVLRLGPQDAHQHLGSLDTKHGHAPDAHRPQGRSGRAHPRSASWA
mmetsp:Transcript_47925/g.91617  ORF Transcript_47925/g.91617 Transcript_47925/m.91617 type:complete len:243 (-) Transcript_47925:377-1105(-)